jgi:hypothetical protein
MPAVVGDGALLGCLGLVHCVGLQQVGFAGGEVEAQGASETA